MKAAEIYRSLSTEPSYWAAQSAKVRWLASRYYAGVDTATQLWAATKPVPVSKDFNLNPPLSEDTVREIIRLR